MKALLEQVARSQQALGTILMIGAGAGSCLPLMRALASERLVLAEAHAPQAEELARRIQPTRCEEVWPLAIVAAPAKQATLHILNNPQFNSLKPPTGLAQHYPNLRPISQAEVATRTLAESIATLTLDPSREHLLILDAPGQAGELLSITSAQALQSFKWIILRCGVTPLYADDEEAESLLEQLAKVGFDTLEEDPQSLYPQASFLLARNQARAEMSRLEARLAQAVNEYDAQALLARQRTQELEQLTRDCNEANALAKRYKTDLEIANETVTAHQQLSTDLKAQIQKLTHERDEQAKLATQLKAELDKAGKQSQERATRIAQLESQCDNLNQRQVQLNLEIVRAEAQIDLIKDVLLRENRL